MKKQETAPNEEFAKSVNKVRIIISDEECKLKRLPSSVAHIFLKKPSIGLFGLFMY